MIDLLVSLTIPLKGRGKFKAYVDFLWGFFFFFQIVYTRMKLIFQAQVKVTFSFPAVCH